MTHPNFVRTQAHTIVASRYHRDLNKYTHTGTNRNYVHGEHTIDVENNSSASACYHLDRLGMGC